MENGPGRLSIRLDEDQLQALDEYVSREGYGSRSEAVRDAISELLEAGTPGLQHRRLQLDLPLVLVERVDSLVDTGVLLDRPTGLLEVMRKGVESLEDDLLERGERLERKREQMTQGRKARERRASDVKP